MDFTSIYQLLDQGNYIQSLDVLAKLSDRSAEVVLFESQINREMGNFERSLKLIENLILDNSLKISNDDENRSLTLIRAKTEQIITNWRLCKFGGLIEEIQTLLESVEGKGKADVSSILNHASLYKIKGNIYGSLGEYSNTLINYRKAASIYEDVKNNHGMASIYGNIGYTYLLLGEINLAEDHLTQSIELSENGKQQDYARSISYYGVLLIQRGKYDVAHEYLRKALQIQKRIGNGTETAFTLFELITLAILMNNIDEARSLLDDLRSEFEQSPHAYVFNLYELGEAVVKKSGNRFKSKLEAAKILQKIIDKKPFSVHYHVMAMKLLCEILLEELQVYENIEILGEITTIVLKLESLGQQEGSSWVLNEALLLKSKLYLIDNRIAEAIETLIEAQNIATKKGLTQLAHHISNVYNDLKYQLAFWEEQDQRNASLKERVQQSDIIDLVQPLQSKSVAYQIKETEKPVLLLIINPGGSVKLRYKFGVEESLHEHLIGGFLSAINSFFSDVFTEKNSIDRIRSKGYTILMRSTTELLYCYIFKGQSLFAAQKLESFVQEVKINPKFMQTFSSLADVITPNVRDPINISPLINKFFG